MKDDFTIGDATSDFNGKDSKGEQIPSEDKKRSKTTFKTDYTAISEEQIKHNTKLFADSDKNREILNQIHKVRAELNKLEGILK